MGSKLDDASHTVTLQIRISAAEKEAFFKACEQQCINPSLWLRKQIKDFTASVDNNSD